MIPYGRQFIDQGDIEAVVEVLRSDYLTQGPKILEFEKALAKYCKAKYAVAVSSGTAALHLAYLAADLKKGDEVITTPNTFVATTNMLLTIGACPVFCDIRLDTYNIDEKKIEKLITKKTKALVPVHFAGQPCEMEKIYKIVKKFNLLVVEDACHALGAKYTENIKIQKTPAYAKATAGKQKTRLRVGSCKYSDMAVFSFHPVKSITTGEGGAILTNNKNYYKKLLLLRNHGIYKDKKWKNVMVELGFNYRLTDLQCALGLSQLKKLDRFIKKRRQVVKWYEKELKDVKDIILPQETKGNYSGWHLYVIRVNRSTYDLQVSCHPEFISGSKKMLKQVQHDQFIRDRLIEYLKKDGIGVNFHYPAVYAHPYYQRLGFKKKLKNEEIYQSSCLTLPLHPQLTKKEIKYIANKIKLFFQDL